MTRLALFDCDGTLVDSAANICLAVERAFDAHRLAPPPRDAIRGIVGLSLPQAMAVLHPDADPVACEALSQSYKDAFAAMRGTPDFAHEPLYPGIADALATLADSGWALGVATGKSDRGLSIILATHGLTSAFVTLQTADRHPSKPDPAMALAAMTEAGADAADTVMIGDTSYDMAMGRAAGAHAIGVAWGYHPPALLTAAGAMQVVDHADDLADAMLACVAPRSISAA
ncbi:haloacid dehalogenase [Sphingomonas sp. Leaf33]|uniref:HAD-IA family hydrolase n=1 Tax=Sphingomonas sp. Leaf33 TaxID=1736215 RepID=UPI0006FF4176|nr:HAD-IA family hydrolase [Sphingomonas sp. Leaf33]KQN25280.1 haloacid dehalogenase [Sphingomonas sp. Leaf33]